MSTTILPRKSAISKHSAATGTSRRRQCLPPESKRDPTAIYIPASDAPCPEHTVEMVSGISIDAGNRTSLIFETLWDGKGLSFAVASGGGFTIHPFLIRGQKAIVPPEDEHDILKRGFVLLPSGIGSYGSEDDLDKLIYAYLKRYVDASEFELKLMRAFAKMTWVYGAFSSLPYLRFRGDWGSGKTRKMQVVGWICYRGNPISGSMSGAPLFRLMDKFHGCLLIDEADYRSSDETSDIIKILNDGYKRGIPVIAATTTRTRYPTIRLDLRH